MLTNREKVTILCNQIGRKLSFSVTKEQEEEEEEDMEVEGNESGRTARMAKEVERKNINDWLPITKSRNAKWWYSAFHNVTAVVGAGVLGFPYAMSELGWFVHQILFPVNF